MTDTAHAPLAAIRQTALGRLSQLVVDSGDVATPPFGEALACVLEGLPADGAAIALDERDGGVRLPATHGLTEQGLAQLVTACPPDPLRGCLVVDDWRLEQHAPATPARLGIRSSLAATLAPEGMIAGVLKRAGVLSLHARTPRAWSPDDALFLGTAANLVAAIVRREDLCRLLAFQASTDATTGLPNRHGFDTMLSAALVHGARRIGDGQIAVLLSEVRGVDEVNRALGHHAGDDVLRELAARLSARLPASQRLARFSGTQLVLLCEDVTSELDAISAANDLIEAISRPLLVGDTQVWLSASVGIGFARGASDASGVLRDADTALQRARALGDNRCAIGRAAGRDRAARQLRLESELRAALEHDEFSLHYQPIVSLRRGDVTSVEALLRWEHPTRGTLPPSEFIPVAERSDLIVELGDWVIAEACRESARWRALAPPQPHPAISVNVSARQLRSGGFVNRVAAALLATGIAPASIALEITESTVMEVSDRPVETLAALKRLGVKIVLDDFGTGYSSLAYLSRLPLDSLKIDRSFIRAVTTSLDPIPIVDAVLGMGHALGLTVVAEGVETEAQLAAVRSAGVDAVQGYLVARPAPIASLLDLRALHTATTPDAARHVQAELDEREAWISLGAAAEALGVSASTVRRLADEGVLRGSRTSGGHRRFRRIDVQRFAQERGRRPSLRALDLPTTMLPAAALLIERNGPVLLERVARATYETWSPGWFALAGGRTRAVLWLNDFCTAIGSGTTREAIEVTVEFLDAATLAGSTLAECVRFMEQFAAITSTELLRARVDAEEARAVRRLTTVAVEELLDRLG